jgi:hypothetical protein
MKKGKEIKTLNLKPLYLFDLVINQKEKRTVVEIENFGERLLVFSVRWFARLADCNRCFGRFISVGLSRFYRLK